MEEFKKLYNVFLRRTSELAASRVKNGRTPFFDRAVEAFKSEVVEPMERIWAGLSEPERADFWANGGARREKVGNNA